MIKSLALGFLAGVVGVGVGSVGDKVGAGSRVDIEAGSGAEIGVVVGSGDEIGVGVGSGDDTGIDIGAEVGSGVVGADGMMGVGGMVEVGGVTGRGGVDGVGEVCGVILLSGPCPPGAKVLLSISILYYIFGLPESFLPYLRTCFEFTPNSKAVRLIISFCARIEIRIAGG